MKNLLAITVAGQLRWLKEAISTLCDDLDVLVIDDATPGNSIKDFCFQQKLKIVTKLKPMGLTNSWNLAYQYFKEHNYDNCILSNDDVLFPTGFSRGLFEGLKEFDLIGPLSNEPGFIWDDVHSPVHQEVRRYVDVEPNKNNIDKIQQTLTERYGNGQIRQSNYINGFCLAFSRSIAKFVYNRQFLFDPAHINTWNEYDLADRISGKDGKIGICKSSYVFHWKGKTTEKLDKDWGQPGDYREQLWKMEDNKKIEIKEVPLDEYIKKLKNNKYFSFVRYGDGEWKALLEGSGTVACGQQVVNRQMQSDMVRSLTEHAIEPGIVFGMQRHGLHIYRQLIPDFLRDQKLENIRWVNADIFHKASRDGLLYPLIEQLRKMKVVVIGPNLLKSLSGHFKYVKFIKTKAENCYADQAAIRSSILKVHKELKENVIYMFCCGPLAETLILDLYLQMPNNFLIDFGSLWDVFCGVRSRGYTQKDKYVDDVLRKNVGLKPAFRISGWIDRDEAKVLEEGKNEVATLSHSGRSRKIKIGAILPHLGMYGGVRHFLEIGNIFISRGMDYTIFSNQGQRCDWFKCNFPIKNWDKIEADYIMASYPPDFRILPAVKGRVFIYIIAGGHFLEEYQVVYGRYPFILNNRVFSKYFPDSHLVEGGVNTEWFKPKKRKVLFYDDPRPCKGSTYIKKQLSGIDNIELIGLKGLSNEQIAKAYRKGDYFVSWESREGWSNPSAEAIASGLTVVTNGVNCEPFSDRVITVENLREFFADPMKEFSWERVVDKLLEMFKEKNEY